MFHVEKPLQRWLQRARGRPPAQILALKKLNSLLSVLFEAMAIDLAPPKRKKPTWRNTQRYSATSAYLLTGHPD
jgi:hypothetical protein